MHARGGDPLAPGGDCDVLIIEDDADLRDMMVQLLQLEGFDTEAASDSAEALGKLRDRLHLPRLILLDLMTPVMDGWQFCQHRADDVALSRVPVVLLTAVPAHQARTAVGVDGILAKPFDYDTLVDTVREYCR